MSSRRLLLAAIINSRPPSVPNRATCGSKTELARCTETKYRPELGHPLSKRSLGNAPFLKALFFLAEKGTVWVRVSNSRGPGYRMILAFYVRSLLALYLPSS